ncbi:MAG: exodeoxyribonuclease VII large subunit, partial [Ilumatobacteraceae bacterium]
MAVPDPFDDRFDDDTDDGDRPGLTPDDAYTVSELAAEIKEILGEVYRGGVWLQGEINGLSVKDKNTYFTLSEPTPDGKRVKLDAALWYRDGLNLAAKMKSAGIELKNDLKVRVKVTIDFYAPFGKLSVHVKDIDPRFTLGELALEREALVRRLKDSGAYDRNKGTSLSPVPLRVGVVTSASSAAWADFMEGIEESGIGFQVMLVNVSVQGDLAVGQVSRAIRALSRRDDLDVVVVIRGGGGKDELSTFDAEPIALAIAESRLPVFTGVGHEIDTSVADEVAFR